METPPNLSPVKAVVAVAKPPVAKENKLERLLPLLESPDFRKDILVQVRGTGFFTTKDEEEVADSFVTQAVASVSNPLNSSRGEIKFAWEPEQVRTAIIGLAARGLPYNPIQGLGYIVGYKDKQKPGCYNVSPIPGVRGLERIIQRTGKVGAMKCTAVRAHDIFECNEFGKEPPKHIKKQVPPGTPNPILYGCASIYVRGIEGYHNVTIPVDESALSQMDGYMNPEQRAGYLAYRKCIREVTNTYLHDARVLAGAVADDLAAEDQKHAAETTKPVPVVSAAEARPVIELAEPVIPQPLAAVTLPSEPSPLDEAIASSAADVVAAQQAAIPPPQPPAPAPRSPAAERRPVRTV